MVRISRQAKLESRASACAHMALVHSYTCNVHPQYRTNTWHHSLRPRATLFVPSPLCSTRGAQKAYFSKFRISDESYFQTTLCHPHAPEAFPVFNDNLRHVNWPVFDEETEWVLHPDPVEPKHVKKLMNSGALFARKFEYGTSDQAWSNIEGILSMKVLLYF